MKKATVKSGRVKFRTTLLGAGKSATGVEVPPEVVEALGSHKRPPVRVTIKGHTYRSTVAVMGGRFMIGISAENRKAAGVGVGDEVDVGLELDTAPREVTVPHDFKKALGRVPGAKRHFEGLSYSKKKSIVEGIESAKTAETRERRIEKVISTLRAGAI